MEIFDFDTILLAFVRTNMITLGLVGGVLGIIAKKLHLGWLTEILTFLRDKMDSKGPGGTNAG